MIPKGRAVASSSNFREMADRIRTATASLTDPRDLQVVRDYLTELEILAAQEEAALLRPRLGSLMELAD